MACKQPPRKPVRLRARITLLSCLLLAAVATPMAGAQMQHAESAGEFAFYPDAVDYDPAIPTLEQVVGHEWGDRITSPDEVAV